MNTQHTDSVEETYKEFAVVWMNNYLETTPSRRKEVIKEFFTTLQATHQQQVEEAVRQERERIRTIIQPQIDSANTSQSYAPGSSERYAYENGSKTAAMYIQEALNKALTPNHQN